MKNNRLLLFFVLISVSIILTACTGGAGQASSWPGLTLDPDGEVAYVAYGTAIYAVNLESFTQVWRYPLERDNKINFFATPAITEDGQLIAGSFNHLLYSINLENGQGNQQSWPFDGAENTYVGGTLADGNMIYAPSSDNSLYALDLSGNLKWTYAAEDAVWGTPVTDGKYIFLPSMDHRMYALDPQTGREVWKTEPLNGSIAGVPTLGPGGQLFVGTFGSELVALDSATGKVLWRAPASNWVWTGPALDNDWLYFGDLDGVLHGLELTTDSYLERWVYPNANSELSGEPEVGQITGKPVVLDGVVYFGSESGYVYAIDAESGEFKWAQPVNGKIYTDLKLVGDKILVATMGKDELLYMFETDGSQFRSPFIPQN